MFKKVGIASLVGLAAIILAVIAYGIFNCRFELNTTYGGLTGGSITGVWCGDLVTGLQFDQVDFLTISLPGGQAWGALFYSTDTFTPLMISYQAIY